jgi:hypothetical protein
LLFGDHNINGFLPCLWAVSGKKGDGGHRGINVGDLHIIATSDMVRKEWAEGAARYGTAHLFPSCNMFVSG